jgi:hypothetical protein
VRKGLKTRLITSVADKTVQLMHQSAREFFLQIEREKPDSKFALNREEAHRAITTTSIRYLMLCFTIPEPVMRYTFSNVNTWSSEDFQIYVRYMGEWPWINYALHYLKNHHELCGQKESVSQQVHALIEQLTNSKASEFLGDWIAYRFGQTKFEWGFLRLMASLTPLRYMINLETSQDFKYKVLDTAAMLGLSRVFQSLLLPCTQIDALAQSETPLILCARKGLADASRVLLDLNEDVDAKDLAGRTALHHAAENGYEAIVRLLLKRRANREAKDKRGFIPIQLAVAKL